MAASKPQNSVDSDVRLAVVETKIETLTDFIQEHKDSFKELSITVNDIKERLDKQNGALPHLVENMAALTKEISSMSHKINSHDSKLAVSNIYSKLIWGVVALISTVAGGIIIEYITHK